MKLHNNLKENILHDTFIFDTQEHFADNTLSDLLNAALLLVMKLLLLKKKKSEYLIHYCI